MDPGYPKDIIRNWRGIPRNIDAALTSVFDGINFLPLFYGTFLPLFNETFLPLVIGTFLPHVIGKKIEKNIQKQSENFVYRIPKMRCTKRSGHARI